MKIINLSTITNRADLASVEQILEEVKEMHKEEPFDEILVCLKRKDRTPTYKCGGCKTIRDMIAMLEVIKYKLLKEYDE